jgi:hypothetical protein
MEFFPFKSDYAFVNAKFYVVDLSYIFSSFEKTYFWTPNNSVNLYLKMRITWSYNCGLL